MNREEIINIVLEKISEGESLRAILHKGNDMISRKTFNEWLSEDTVLSDHYARTCEDRQNKIFEEILDIADNTAKDTDIREAGSNVYEVPNTEWIQRSKIRIDARKWMLGKMNPKKYGDKLEVDQKNTNTNFNIEVTKEEAKEINKFLEDEF